MRRALVLFFAVGALAVNAWTQSPGSLRPQDDQQVRKIEAEAAQFEQANDLSIIGLLADGWVCSSNRRVMTRADLEEGVKRNFTAHGNSANPYTVEKRNMVVYLFGDTAVVTYIKEYRQTADRSQIHDEDITDVFVRSPKSWLWQFSKVAPIAANSAPPG
jgi:hypothetical protein